LRPAGQHVVTVFNFSSCFCMQHAASSRRDSQRTLMSSLLRHRHVYRDCLRPFCAFPSTERQEFSTFLPRGGLLAWHLLSSSVRHKSDFCRNGRTNRAGFGYRSLFRPILHYVLRKFMYLQNKGTCLCNFVPNSASRSCCRQYLSTVVLVDNTYDRRCLEAVYCKSVHRNPLTPLLRFVVDLSYNLFLWSCSSVSTDIARRAVSRPLFELLIVIVVNCLDYTLFQLYT